MQENIQVYGKRPFGVGLLIIGYDVRFLKIIFINLFLKDSGPHVLNADPSANVTMVKAASIG